jgi:hypothetical protein
MNLNSARCGWADALRVITDSLGGEVIDEDRSGNAIARFDKLYSQGGD